MDARALDRLFATILSRRGASASESYTAKLMKAGIRQCAKKLGEEGVEAALAAVCGKRKDLISESADLLYHLLVVWAVAGIKPDAVYETLEKRKSKSGLAEKRERKRTLR
jgi:phosphoribosyl-ATP pyrophosphohydrolase